MYLRTTQIQHRGLLRCHGTVVTTTCNSRFSAALFRFVKPWFGCINPDILTKTNEKILEDEIVWPSPLMLGSLIITRLKEDDIAGRQCLQDRGWI